MNLSFYRWRWHTTELPFLLIYSKSASGLLCLQGRVQSHFQFSYKTFSLIIISFQYEKKVMFSSTQQRTCKAANASWAPKFYDVEFLFKVLNVLSLKMQWTRRHYYLQHIFFCIPAAIMSCRHASLNWLFNCVYRKPTIQNIFKAAVCKNIMAQLGLVCLQFIYSVGIHKNMQQITATLGLVFLKL